MASILEKLNNADKDKFKAKMEKPFIYTLAFLCVLELVVLDIPPLLKSIKAQSWPTILGRVIHYDVKHRTLGKEPAWDPVIKYVYQIGGVNYEGTELRFQRYYGLGGYDAFQLKDKYPDNAPVIIHYDPRNPNVSVIQTTPSFWRVVYNFVCCVLWAALIYFSTYVRVGPEAPTPAHLSAVEEPEYSNSDVEEPVPAS
jgi:Protein of unknown function (DUF3592).